MRAASASADHAAGTAIRGTRPKRERLAESAMYFDFVSKELPLMLDRWEAYKAAHGD
jgi:hypothetical protein